MDVISLPVQQHVDYDDALGIDMDQTAGDMAVFVIPWRCIVHSAGLSVTEDCTGDTTTPIVKFDRRVSAGSDVGRGNGDIGTFDMGTTEAGKTLIDMAANGTELEPGDEIVVELATAATGTAKSGHARPFVLVRMDDEALGNMAAVIEV